MASSTLAPASAEREGSTSSFTPAPTALGTGARVFIRGTIVSHEDLYLNGEIEAPIEAVHSTVTIGPDAQVIADIEARKVVIWGSVEGNIHALVGVEVRGEGKLIGDIMAARIAIDYGAYFQGAIKMVRPAIQNVQNQKASGREMQEALAHEERFSKLVDVKYSRALTSAEQQEAEGLAARLEALDAGFYGRLLKSFRGITPDAEL